MADIDLPFNARNGITIGPTQTLLADNAGHITAPSLTTTGTLNVTGTATIGTLTATNIASNQNLSFGLTGASGPGTIYSDINWGCLVTAKQASPSVSEFAVRNASLIERLRIDSLGNTNIYGSMNVTGNVGINGTLTATTTTQPVSTNNSSLASTAFVQAIAAANPSGTIIDFTGFVPPTGYLQCPLIQTNLSRASYANLWSALHVQGNVTISIATPGIITWPSHVLYDGLPIILSTTGSLPTGLTIGTTYYVVNSIAGVSFQLSTSVGGAAINTTGTQSGIHSAICAPWGIGDGTTTFGMPWFPVGYASLQNPAGVGVSTVGQVQDHTNAMPPYGPQYAGAFTGVAGFNIGYTSTGGITSRNAASNNYAAGVGVMKCVKI